MPGVNGTCKMKAKLYPYMIKPGILGLSLMKTQINIGYLLRNIGGFAMHSLDSQGLFHADMSSNLNWLQIKIVCVAILLFKIILVENLLYTII